jgi:hypothetical protein
MGRGSVRAGIPASLAAQRSNLRQLVTIEESVKTKEICLAKAPRIRRGLRSPPVTRLGQSLALPVPVGADWAFSLLHFKA